MKYNLGSWQFFVTCIYSLQIFCGVRPQPCSFLQHLRIGNYYYYILLKYEMEICVAKIQQYRTLQTYWKIGDGKVAFFCKSKYMGLIRHGLCNYLHIVYSCTKKEGQTNFGRRLTPDTNWMRSLISLFDVIYFQWVRNVPCCECFFSLFQSVLTMT